MKAKFIFEKFKQNSDPIKDMGIGYSKKQLNSKAFKILSFIRSKGEEGASLTEIQFYIWTELNGYSAESFWEKDRTGKRLSRGYWTTNLYGHSIYSYVSRNIAYGEPRGILYKFCIKNNKGKWVLKRMPRPNERFY